jgi:RNA polymerase subunit RPABC4/transcription elongation factor Spt4
VAALFAIVAGIASAVYQPPEEDRLRKEEKRRCPFCKEIVHLDASICKFCRSPLGATKSVKGYSSAVVTKPAAPSRGAEYKACANCRRQINATAVLCHHCKHVQPALTADQASTATRLAAQASALGARICYWCGAITASGSKPCNNCGRAE